MINQNVNTCNFKVVCSILDTAGVTLTQIAFEINLAVAAEGSRLSPECLQATAKCSKHILLWPNWSHTHLTQIK